MPHKIPTVEPSRITKGDRVTWKKHLPDYLPVDGWIVSYYFVNAAGVQVEVAGTDNGDGYHLIDIDVTTSDTFTPGLVFWQAVVKDADDEEYTVARGRFEVIDSFEDKTAAFDARSSVKKILDAIVAVIEGRATEKDLAYSIAGRSITKMTLAELTDARARYQALYDAEVTGEAIEQGRGHKGLIKLRMP